MNYYVAYMTSGNLGGTIITSNVDCETMAGICEIADYISKEYAHGKEVVILNIIKLKD